MIVLLLFLFLNQFEFRFFGESFIYMLQYNLPSRMANMNNLFFPVFFYYIFSLFCVYRAAFNNRQPSLRSPMKPSILLIILNIPFFCEWFLRFFIGGGSPSRIVNLWLGYETWLGMMTTYGFWLFIIVLPFFCAYQLRKKDLKLFPKGLENFNPPNTKKTDTPTIRRFSAAWLYILFISLFCLVISCWGWLGTDFRYGEDDTTALIGMVSSLLISVFALVFAFGQYRYFCPKCKTRCNNKIIDSTTHNTTQRRRDGAVDRRFNTTFSTEYQHQYVCTNEECSHNFTEWTYRGPTWYERRDYHNLKWYNL